MILDEGQLAIGRFCAIECELQRSGERSVSWMLDAWTYAQLAARNHAAPDDRDVRTLGTFVEPNRNAKGYRQVPVRVGHDVKSDWHLVPRQMENLLLPETIEVLGPAEWFREYEDVHPFVDGNGRTGQILFNWLNGTLGAPKWAPNFWDDERRLEGAGA